jgi:hypothetical protein
VVSTNIFTSQRNRPEHLRNETRSEAARQMNAEMMQQIGIDPAVVADLVADAVEHDRFWIFTHPELLDAVDERHRGVMAARDQR